MTPQDFITKWRQNELKERSASQSHFNDLCRLLGVPDPNTDDPKGEWFTFEKGASKTTGGEGWADVWRKDCFAWEYKGKAKDLDKAFAQLQQYAIALDNPPLLIVSDMDRICRRQHDPGAPDILPGCVSVGAKSFQLRRVDGAKVKADGISPHAPNMAQAIKNGNRPSGGQP